MVEDNNDGTSVAAFTTSLQKVAEKFGTAVVVTTGAGKMTGKMLKEGGERRGIVKGSEVWSRTGGTIFTLTSEHDGTKKTRRLIVQHRNADTENYLLELRDGLLCLTADPAAVGAKADELEWLSKQAASWFNFVDVQRGCEVSKAKAYELLIEWRKRQVVDRRLNGKTWEYRWKGVGVDEDYGGDL